METIDLSHYYSVKDVAELLSITPSHVTFMLREGRLKGRRIGKKMWFVDKLDFDEYLIALKRVRGEE